MSLNALYRFDEFELDPSQRSLTRNGATLSLSSKGLQVLSYLVANPGRVVTKEELLKAVWPESFVEESNLPGYISGLRKVLTDRSSCIATVPGQGYQFTARVQAETPADPPPQPRPEDLQPQNVQFMRERSRIVIRETSSPAALTQSKPLLHRWTVWAGIAVAIFAGAATWYGFYIHQQSQELSKVIVGDFLNLTGDPSFDHTLKSDLDPKFAMAQASLGTAYLTLGDTKKAGGYSKVAFDLSGGVSQWERLYIRYNYYLMTLHDLDSAVSDTEEWTRIYPRDETSWQALSYVEIQIGNYPAAGQAARHALQMSPVKYVIEYENIADASMREGRLADAKRTIAEAQAQGKDRPALHQLLLQIAFLEHDPQAMQREVAWAGGHPELWSSLEIEAILAADPGREQESESLFHSTILDSIKEGQSSLTDSMMLDEPSPHFSQAHCRLR